VQSRGNIEKERSAAKMTTPQRCCNGVAAALQRGCDSRERAQISTKHSLCERKTRMKKGLQICGEGIESKKGPRWSWSRNQMGNAEIIVFHAQN
jgi:hypothetical protein